MTEGVISARALPSVQEPADARDGATLSPELEISRPQTAWNPQTFAREQIRGLVRQVFLAGRPVRQVVFSAVEADSDLRNLCRSVGEALAAQAHGTVAVVGGYPRLQGGNESQASARGERDAARPLRQIAARVRGNLWLVPDGRTGGGCVSAASLQAYLSEVRRQFEYSIVEAAPAASDETLSLAQFADGIILVLSAHHTRRAAARQIKAALAAAQVHILGAVLSDRVFPIPEAIYRRL